MEWKRIIIVIEIIIFSLISVVGLTQIISADESQDLFRFNPEICFSNNYEFEVEEYNFIKKDHRLPRFNFDRRFASIHQEGNENESKICQIGITGSIVEIVQIGNKNKAEVKQYANSTKAEIFQFGNNHKVTVEQWRSGGTVYVIQSGNNYEDKEINIVQF